jgi:glycosyltransferase involved in cell wall biosynthesis
LQIGENYLKIVHVSQYYDDNAGYQENIFPFYQSILGHEVTVITSTLRSGYIYKDRVVEAGDYREKGFAVKRIPIKGEFKNRFVIFDNLYKYLQEEKPDYIYHYSVTAPSIKDVAKYKRENPDTFLAVDSHADLNNSGRNKLWKTIYYNFFWKMFIRKYDPWINVYFGPSANRCIFMEEELGIPKEKIRLLPIGCDKDSADVSISKEDFFQRYMYTYSYHGGLN